MSKQLTSDDIKFILNRYRTPAEAHQFLQDAGLIDENGDLAKPYRLDNESYEKI